MRSSVRESAVKPCLNQRYGDWNFIVVTQMLTLESAIYLVRTTELTAVMVNATTADGELDSANKDGSTSGICREQLQGAKGNQGCRKLFKNSYRPIEIIINIVIVSQVSASEIAAEMICRHAIFV